MVIGGAEDKVRDRVILSRFAKLAGGAEARIVLISTASSLGEAATDLYRQLFADLGIHRLVGLQPVTREEANDQDTAEAIDAATGIFLTGGNQLRLALVCGGTVLGQALIRAHGRGAVVAGTSAGASAVSSHMIAFGASGATPKHRMAQLAAGLGLLDNVVVDQHFEQRTRLGRLLAVVAQSPSLMGLGLDEDTAAIVYPDQTLEVIGRGAVTLIDGRSMVTDAFHAKGHRPMMVSGAVLHSLPSGYRFDLKERVLLPSSIDPNRRDYRPLGRTGRRPKKAARTVTAEGAGSLVGERRRGPLRTEEASE
jgi:cyanophycinase